MKKLIIILLSLNSFICFHIDGQTLADINIHQKMLQSQKEKVIYKEAKDNKNELQFVFSGLFLFYKSFISSQDGISCVFSPSCSEYGLLAIKHKGLIHGMVNTFDRLTRCHGLNPEKYQTISNSPLLYDPLQ